MADNLSEICLDFTVKEQSYVPMNLLNIANVRFCC